MLATGDLQSHYRSRAKLLSPQLSFTSTVLGNAMLLSLRRPRHLFVFMITQFLPLLSLQIVPFLIFLLWFCKSADANLRLALRLWVQQSSHLPSVCGSILVSRKDWHHIKCRRILGWPPPLCLMMICCQAVSCYPKPIYRNTSIR